MAISEVALKHFNKGKDLYKQGKFPSAIRYFNACLSMNMLSAQCHVFIGLCYYYMLDLLKAFNSLQMALSLSAVTDDTYYFLGHIMSLFENDEEAKNYYKKAVNESKNQAYALLAYSRLESMLEPTERRTYLEKALLSYVVKVNLDPYEEQLKEALSCYIEKKYDEALLLFENLIKDYPNYFEAFYSLPFLYKRMEKNKEEQKAWKILSHKFKHLKLSYIEIAQNHFNLKEYSKSVSYLKRVIKILPLNNKMYFNLGMLYNLLKQNEKAVFAYQQSLQLKDDFYPSYYNLAVTYYKMGKTTQALRQYHRACIIEPGSYHVYYNMGMIYFENKDYVNALFNLNKSYQLNTEFTEAYNNFQYIGLLRSVDSGIVEKVGYSSVLKMTIVVVAVLILLTVLSFLGLF